jgi:chemotaxis protein methyltransferase CheR
MKPADFDFIRHFVRDEAAIVLEPGKEYLVESRMHELARQEKFASIEELVHRLRHRKVVDAMTTNETSFFRDLHPFETMRRHLFPDLLARRRHERRLTFWCGASSTGQEPYSVLMLIAEHFPELFHWDFKFIATDLNAEVLARARAGRFSQIEINRGLPAPFLVKYFTRQGTEWEIREDFRSRIDFRQMNLVKDWPFLPPADLILMRNVLIYFDTDTKKSILNRARRLLRPDGYLLLGGAETTLNLDESYERVTFDKTICYRQRGSEAS